MEPNHLSRRKDTEKEGGFIRTPISTEAHSARTFVSFDGRHQGWNDLPHGGILMSMILELAHRGLSPTVFHEEMYPLRVVFRLGGPSLLLSDRVELSTCREEGRILGRVVKEGETQPSLEAGIHERQPISGFERLDMERINSALETIGRGTGNRSLPLPYSRNCFVCGVQRESPGLERRFHCMEGGDTKLVFTYMGLDPDDQERFHRFRLDDGQAHPGVLISILDETLGWAGFVQERQGGVTVKLEVDIFRPADPGEKMLCFGTCTGTRGRPPNRFFWSSEGAVLPMGDGDMSPIMTARGQWLAVPKLTGEMKRHLIPRDLTDPWFPPEKG